MFFEREVDLSLYYCTEITFCLTFGSGVFRLQFLRVRKCKQQGKTLKKGKTESFGAMLELIMIERGLFPVCQYVPLQLLRVVICHQAIKMGIQYFWLNLAERMQRFQYIFSVE